MDTSRKILTKLFLILGLGFMGLCSVKLGSLIAIGYNGSLEGIINNLTLVQQQEFRLAEVGIFSGLVFLAIALLLGLYGMRKRALQQG